MPIVSIGDMSRHFISLRNSGEIKSDLARLGQELSSGKRSDLVSSMGGDTRQLLGINHSIGVVDQYLHSANKTAMMLDNMQLALGRVDDTLSRSSETLLKINAQSQALQIDHATDVAKMAFGDIVATINSSHAGHNNFGGINVGGPALAGAEDMLADIAVALAGTNTISGAEQIIDDWFDEPSGGFATMGYLGDSGAFSTKPIGQDQKIEINVRADNTSLREILKATAIAASLPSISGNFSTVDQGAILQRAGERMLTASRDAVQMQTKIGTLQETVAIAQTRLTSEKASLGIAHNSLTSADPFETATRLQAVQLQLETHFTVTSRLSRLSLLEYI